MNFQYIERGFGANHFIRVDQTVYEVSASRFTLYGKTRFNIDAASVVTVVENQNLVFAEKTPVSLEVLKANEYLFIRALQQNDYERRKAIATANANYYSACRKANGARRAEYQRRGW